MYGLTDSVIRQYDYLMKRHIRNGCQDERECGGVI